jgi:hypothetical protein
MLKIKIEFIKWIRLAAVGAATYCSYNGNHTGAIFLMLLAIWLELDDINDKMKR